MRKENYTAMIALAKECKQSGMTIGDFAKKKGLSKSTLGYWVRKMNIENMPKNKNPQFIELGTLPANPEISQKAKPQKTVDIKPQIELSFPGGLCLKIYG